GTTGDVVTELTGQDRPVLSIAVSEKPGYLATGGADGTVRVYRSADFALIEEYRNPYGPIWATDFAADGKSMFLGGLDAFVTAWQIAPRPPFEAIDSPYPRRFLWSEAGDEPLARGRIQSGRKCSVCHTLESDDGHRAGTTVVVLFRRNGAGLLECQYYDAFERLAIEWSEDTMDGLLELEPDISPAGAEMPWQKRHGRGQRG